MVLSHIRGLANPRETAFPRVSRVLEVANTLSVSMTFICAPTNPKPQALSYHLGVTLTNRASLSPAPNPPRARYRQLVTKPASPEPPEMFQVILS